MTRFLHTLPPHGPERNAAVLAAIQQGRVDPPTWVPVHVGSLTVEVTADYLTIVGDRIPMVPANAQLVADLHDALLPTATLVTSIEEQARKTGCVVPFDAWPRYQDDSQLETSTILWRETNVARHLAELNPPPGTLLAGHLKDVVLAPSMPDGKVVIFGGLYESGKRVQPQYAGHGAYFDGGYAHGVRLVRVACTLNGSPARLDEVLQAGALGGPVQRLRYALPADTSAPSHATLSVVVQSTAITPTPSVLRRGDRGPAVKDLQRLLTAAGFPADPDGIYGPNTERQVRAFQEDHPPLRVDGLAGPKTMAALRDVAKDDPTDPYGDTDRPTDPYVRKLLTFEDMPDVLSDAEVDDLFGPLHWQLSPTTTERGAIRILNDWQKRNLRRVVIPQLRGVLGAPADGGIFIHRLLVEQTRAMFAAWERDGDAGLLLAWAGTWNPRVVRGYERDPNPILSRHSYATAMDLNAPWNPFHGPAAKLGQKGTLFPLLYRAKEHGFTSLKEHDPMHIEAFAVL